jgi:hypothetical protein
MEPGTFTFHLNVLVKSHNENAKDVRIPVDAVIQPRRAKLPHLPLLIEAKSSGDFTNVNKRRKEEATKINQLTRPPMAIRLSLCCFSADISTQHTSDTKRRKA